MKSKGVFALALIASLGLSLMAPAGGQAATSKTQSSDYDTQNLAAAVEEQQDEIEQALDTADDISSLTAAYVSAAAAYTQGLEADGMQEAGDAIEEIIDGMSDSQIEQYQDTISAYEDATAAIDRCDAYESGEISTEQAVEDGIENSFRYINGTPVAEALSDIAAEEGTETSTDNTTTVETSGLLDAVADALSMSNVGVVSVSAASTHASDSYKYSGVDVSYWQGTIDWEKMAENADFVILRCSHGNGYDSNWDTYADACEKYGIPYGVYHYSLATTKAEIKAEVKMIKTQLKGHTPDLPIYLDMEDATIKTIGASKLSALAKDYCKRMNNNGYKCGVYASLSFWYAYLDSFAKTDTNYHWIAQYASYCAYANADDVAQYAQKNSWAYYKDYHYYETWQYSSTGKGSTYGVSSTYIDLDYWYGSLDLAKLATPENVTGGVLLNWANVSSAKKYYVQRKEADGSFTTIAKLTESEYIDTTVAKGTTYTYRIKYKTKNGTVGYSNKKKITYIKYVTLKKATSTKKGTIKVKFSKSKYATIWKIKYSRYSNFSSSKTLRLEGSLLNTATITGLTSAAKYYLKIKTFMKVDGKAYGSAFSNVLECTVK